MKGQINKIKTHNQEGKEFNGDYLQNNQVKIIQKVREEAKQTNAKLKGFMYRESKIRVLRQRVGENLLCVI